jgi:hypothetical protein
MDINAVIKEAAAAAIPAPAPEPDTSVAPDAEATEAVEDTDLEEAPTDEEQPTEESTDEAAPENADLPDGYVAVPTVTEGLAAEFTLKDAEGEVEVPDLIVEYKANGKVRQDRLDQVVKLAQWGVYNQEREEKVKAMEQAAVERDQLAQLVAEREAQMEKLLTDPDFLYSVQQAYEEENSPEQRAARAEAQVQNVYLQQQMQGISQQGEQFYVAEVAPALDMITKALPTVSEQELMSRMEMAMQAHAEMAPNGVPYVPPSRYDAIRQYIVEDLAMWAQAVHARRATPATPSKAERELERARVQAQKAKRVVGQTTRPVGQPGREGPAKAAKPSNIDDAVSSALNSVLSSIR